jgi:hypothetical protein
MVMVQTLQSKMDKLAQKCGRFPLTTFFGGGVLFGFVGVLGIVICELFGIHVPPAVAVLIGGGSTNLGLIVGGYLGLSGTRGERGP